MILPYYNRIIVFCKYNVGNNRIVDFDKKSTFFDKKLCKMLKRSFLYGTII